MNLESDYMYIQLKYLIPSKLGIAASSDITISDSFNFMATRAEMSWASKLS